MNKDEALDLIDEVADIIWGDESAGDKIRELQDLLPDHDLEEEEED